MSKVTKQPVKSKVEINIANTGAQYKSVGDIDVKNVSFTDLKYAPVDLLINTFNKALESKTSPIIDITERSYPMKMGKGEKGKKNLGKIYVYAMGILCTDGNLYRLGGSGEDNDIGTAGLCSGVKPPNKRMYGISIMFKTKTSKKLGECLRLMQEVLKMDTIMKIDNNTIKTKNKQITDFVKDEISTGDEAAQKEYHDSGDYIVRMNINIKGPDALCLVEERVVTTPIDIDDDEDIGDGKWIHSHNIELNEENVHTILTYGMGMEYWEFGVERKHSGQGISFNIFLATCFPIPRPVMFTKAKPKTNRSTDRRLKFAERAAERAAIMQKNVETLNQRSAKKDDVAKKPTGKNKGKRADAPPQSGSDDDEKIGDFSDATDDE